MILRFTSFVLLFAASFQVHAVNLTLTMNDSYGDGWNGAYWNVYNESGGYVTSGTLATGFSGSVIINLSEGCYSIEVTEGSYPEEISWSLSGMTMPTNVSGGAGDSLPFSVGSATCSFNGLFQMSMTDSGNNGWQGGSWYVQDPFGVVVASGTLLTGSSGNDYFELSDGCYTVGITGGTSSSQMGWTLTNLGTNVVVATGNASTADFSIYV
ncbi:MAG: hypothetical protein JNM00_15780, partial [Flavobacteriales bacterium]|nr:hypothetical protein [Flavobacteriales bacterium]